MPILNEQKSISMEFESKVNLRKIHMRILFALIWQMFPCDLQCNHNHTNHDDLFFVLSFHFFFVSVSFFNSIYDVTHSLRQVCFFVQLWISFFPPVKWFNSSVGKFFGCVTSFILYILYEFYSIIRNCHRLLF